MSLGFVLILEAVVAILAHVLLLRLMSTKNQLLVE